MLALCACVCEYMYTYFMLVIEMSYFCLGGLKINVHHFFMRYGFFFYLRAFQFAGEVLIRVNWEFVNGTVMTEHVTKGANQFSVTGLKMLN